MLAVTRIVAQRQTDGFEELEGLVVRDLRGAREDVHGGRRAAVLANAAHATDLLVTACRDVLDPCG